MQFNLSLNFGATLNVYFGYLADQTQNGPTFLADESLNHLNQKELAQYYSASTLSNLDSSSNYQKDELNDYVDYGYDTNDNEINNLNDIDLKDQNNNISNEDGLNLRKMIQNAFEEKCILM